MRTLTDRFAQADTRDGFHTYRLIIRGEDMAVEMDGKRIIEGRDAFWRPATSPRKFIRFGSTSKPFTGEAKWEFVRLGLRPAPTAAAEKSPLKITISEPWPLNVEEKNTESRPYLYDMGQGLLLTSNPQGSDALLEPYIVRRSTDAGKTWQAIPGIEQNSDSPQELVRLADGRILGPSRWTHLQPDGTLTGKTTILDAKAETFTMHDSTITMPAEFMPAKTGEVLIFERHIWAEKDGSITAVAWSRTTTRCSRTRFIVSATRICCAAPISAKRGRTSPTSASVASPPSCASATANGSPSRDPMRTCRTSSSIARSMAARRGSSSARWKKAASCPTSCS